MTQMYLLLEFYAFSLFEKVSKVSKISKKTLFVSEPPKQQTIFQFLNFLAFL